MVCVYVFGAWIVRCGVTHIVQISNGGNSRPSGSPDIDRDASV